MDIPSQPGSTLYYVPKLCLHNESSKISKCEFCRGHKIVDLFWKKNGLTRLLALLRTQTAANWAAPRLVNSLANVVAAVQTNDDRECKQKYVTISPFAQTKFAKSRDIRQL
jgi:hypothetical protein